MRVLFDKWSVFLVTVVLHGLTTRGRALAAVDTAHYVFLADGLASGAASATFHLGAVRWTKVVFLAVLALARAISSEYWKEIMVVINVLASGLVAVIIVDIVHRTTRSLPPVAFAWALYLGCYEIVQWLPLVLSDMLFVLTALFPFYLVMRRILEPNDPPRWILLTFALMLAMFSRPPGIVVAVLVIFMELVLVQRRIRIAPALALVLLALLALLCVRTAVVHEPSRWPFTALKPKLVEFSAREKKGEVMYDRLDSYRTPPRSAMDHVVIQADRFARFFQVTTAEFSRAHTLINVAYFLPLYGFGLIALAYWAWRSGMRRRSLTIALSMWILCFAALHALTVLDYDWRFRTPVMPHFIILAALGLATVIERFRGAGSPAP